MPRAKNLSDQSLEGIRRFALLPAQYLPKKEQLSKKVPALEE
jgi:hypothetical protein